MSTKFPKNIQKIYVIENESFKIVYEGHFSILEHVKICILTRIELLHRKFPYMVAFHFDRIVMSARYDLTRFEAQQMSYEEFKCNP